ncbi:MAG: hypothetical protein ACYDGR_00740 [Candidatus Dormibacteria bacterium]
MKIRMRIAGPLLGVAALGGGIVAVQAASPSPTGGASYNPASIFVNKLAGILHISSGQAQTDLTQARDQTLDQLVKDGQLTQAQADIMKKRQGAGLGPEFGLGHRFGKHPGGPLGSVGPAVRQAELNAAARSLKTSTTQLLADLRSGKSVADLEKSAGITDDALKSAMTTAARGVLDPAVKAGTITQAQEDAVLARISTNLRGRGGLGPRHRPEPSGSPNPASQG